MQIAAEAILFASGEPVHISRLCMALSLIHISEPTRP